jgi:hypothetical protein
MVFTEAFRTRGALMEMSQPDASVSSEDRVTPDALLHTSTGTECSPEDFVLATGRDITPHNLEWARRKLATEGPAAVEKLLP